MSESEFKVVKVRSIIDLRPSWWRHPIMRWRLRHLMPDIEEQQRRIESLSPGLALWADEERAFLFGEDSVLDSGRGK